MWQPNRPCVRAVRESNNGLGSRRSPAARGQLLTVRRPTAKDAHQHWHRQRLRVQPGGQPVAFTIRSDIASSRLDPWLSYHVCPEKHVVIESLFIARSLLRLEPA